ncbi:hypothetical protein AK830_g8300 [Neonectria ditissima]|uniref:Vacuolar iron transporter Ccc1 n=1 Tax=Neonectria ditissima TaxID=78410 RepID=A0A0P7BCW5_9HYPO|nr:hypothetical protein AK830_g8300 [Neonectria ditissima]
MKLPHSPSLTRFLSDFTLGFSDGLTVPFALTAGLGSLGSTDTVISGGLAELCAGCISMGIGGYLAARDEAPRSQRQNANAVEDEEARGMLSYAEGGEDSDGLVGTEKADGSAEELVRHHLQPLGLPPAVISTILTTLQADPGRLNRAASTIQSHNEPPAPTPLSSSPVMTGLSISPGYTVGGVIPLCPYFFAGTVGLGLRWSICLCLAALFLFGSGKSRLLRGEGAGWRCLWEGAQMLVLGAVAAGTAVACVGLVGKGGG